MRHQTSHEILAMSRYWLAAVAILCLSGVVADAQTDRLEREVKAASQYRLMASISCHVLMANLRVSRG